MTNVRKLALDHRRAGRQHENRRLIPLSGFCEWTPEAHDFGDSQKPLKGRM